jgi:hypothetical protein
VPARTLSELVAGINPDTFDWTDPSRAGRGAPRAEPAAPKRGKLTPEERSAVQSEAARKRWATNPYAARNAEIVAARAAGERAKDVAARYGLSDASVYMICKKAAA